jgi:hypothetical protein
VIAPTEHRQDPTAKEGLDAQVDQYVRCTQGVPGAREEDVEVREELVDAAWRDVREADILAPKVPEEIEQGIEREEVGVGQASMAQDGLTPCPKSGRAREPLVVRCG